MRRDLVFTGGHNKNNWFYNNYYCSGANGRYFTMQAALNLLSQTVVEPVILETGCQRQRDDIGAGMSTSIFAEYISRYGGKLVTVDNNRKHLALAKQFVARFPGVEAEYMLADSVAFLQQYSGRIDFLYLDSWDYPIGEMWQAYGGNPVEANKTLSSLTYEQIMDQFGHLIEPCQEHCLKEFVAAEDHLSDDAIVLIDDNDFPGGGKPRPTKEYLERAGWICLLDYQQTLWVKHG